MHRLYSPIAVGPLALSHRIVHAPMSRLRSGQPGDVPGRLMATHYRQRASDGGLQIAEGASVSVVGRICYGAPGIYSEAQIHGWRRVTDAVHAEGGRAFLQLFHAGRQSHVDLTGGAQPVAPSAVPHELVVFTKAGQVSASPARALPTYEIPSIVTQFQHGSIRARAAGFDGVEIHGGNGYLIDQFIQHGSNKRSDQYGGSIENRVRFLLEVVEAVSSVWGADRVGVRLGPSSAWASMSDSDLVATFSYAANALGRFGLAYLHIIEPRPRHSGAPDLSEAPVDAAWFRRMFKGPIIAAGGFDRDEAHAIVDRGDADMVAFGRLFTSNPDLPERLRLDLPLTPYNTSAFWGGDWRGYNDFERWRPAPDFMR